MKTTFKFIIAAMAAVSVFSSCQKELTTGNPTESTDGIRVISASFSAPTKSTLDGNTPKFVGGEIIKVSNNTSSENCTISVTGEVATFSTTLSGTLTAVYPSTAAKMNGNVIDETAVLVSTVQDGTFASANIAMATGITTSATFTNKTAVIKITPGAGESTRYVEVITAGPEIANDVPEGSTFTKLNKIHVNTTSPKPVYVSILVPSELKVQNLSFADGSNIKTAKDNTDAIAINTISTVTATGWDKPYVEIAGKKWATMNIGATSSTDKGCYFCWGGTEGYKHDGSKWVKASDNTTELSGGFSKANAPYYSSSASAYTTYTTEDGKTVLDLADDAANANWGGSWRMPTNDDFVDLAANCVWYSTTNYNGTGVSGYIVYVAKNDSDKGKAYIISAWNKWGGISYSTTGASAATGTYGVTDPHILFPATGCSSGNSLSNPDNGYYLSSIRSGDTRKKNLTFTVTSPISLGPAIALRYLGESVRALSD